MGTVREKILNALTLFYQAIKSVFVQTSNVVNNCASTSTTYPLSANQGTQLQSQIDDINSTLTQVPIITIERVTGTTNLDSSKKAMITLETQYGNLFSNGFIFGLNAYQTTNAGNAASCAIQSQKYLRFLGTATSVELTYEYFVIRATYI